MKSLNRQTQEEVFYYLVHVWNKILQLPHPFTDLGSPHLVNWFSLNIPNHVITTVTTLKQSLLGIVEFTRLTGRVPSLRCYVGGWHILASHESCRARSPVTTSRLQTFLPRIWASSGDEPASAGDRSSCCRSDQRTGFCHVRTYRIKPKPIRQRNRSSSTRASDAFRPGEFFSLLPLPLLREP